MTVCQYSLLLGGVAVMAAPLGVCAAELPHLGYRGKSFSANPHFTENKTQQPNNPTNV